MPSAPRSSARTASSCVPTFATTSTSLPSVVFAGTRAFSRSASARISALLCLSSKVLIVDLSGDMMTSPCSPSIIICSPDWTERISAPTPTTAGRQSALARIAVWDVAPPAAVQNPRTRLLSRRTVSEGVRSRATMMEGFSSFERSASSTPNKIRITRCPTSRTSAARARKYSSSIASSSLAFASIPSCHAASALI